MRVGWLVAASLMWSAAAIACTCDLDPAPECQRLRSPSHDRALFLGTAKSIRYRSVAVGNTTVPQQLTTFDVEDTFSGIRGKSVEIRSFVKPGMCGLRFRKGIKYFVEAWSNEGAWTASSCGMTTTADWRSDSIHYLRTLRQHPEGAIVFGTVKQYVKGSTFVSLNNKPIPGTTISLELMPNALLNKDKKEVTADSSGSYEFTGLQAGVYSVTVSVPAGFTGIFQHQIELQENGCAQVDVRAHPQALASSQ